MLFSLLLLKFKKTTFLPFIVINNIDTVAAFYEFKVISIG